MKIFSKSPKIIKMTYRNQRVVHIKVIKVKSKFNLQSAQLPHVAANDPIRNHKLMVLKKTKPSTKALNGKL